MDIVCASGLGLLGGCATSRYGQSCQVDENSNADFQDEYTRIMLEEMFSMREIAGVAIWQFTDAKTYTRTSGLRNRSYGVNTGGLYDLYRRPKMAVESVRKIFTGKNEKE